MTGRHAACDRCGARLFTVMVGPFGQAEEIAACSNPNCPTNHPTGPIPITNADRAAAEVEHIKRGLRERLDRGEG